MAQLTVSPFKEGWLEFANEWTKLAREQEGRQAPDFCARALPSMIQKWPLMHASRHVTEESLKETQTEVLVAKERGNTQGSDLGLNSARVPQEVLPQLNNGGVINHDGPLFGSKGHNCT